MYEKKKITRRDIYLSLGECDTQKLAPKYEFEKSRTQSHEIYEKKLISEIDETRSDIGRFAAEPLLNSSLTLNPMFCRRKKQNVFVAFISRAYGLYGCTNCWRMWNNFLLWRFVKHCIFILLFFYFHIWEIQFYVLCRPIHSHNIYYEKRNLFFKQPRCDDRFVYICIYQNMMNITNHYIFSLVSVILTFYTFSVQIALSFIEKISEPIKIWNWPISKNHL